MLVRVLLMKRIVQPANKAFSARTINYHVCTFSFCMIQTDTTTREQTKKWISVRAFTWTHSVRQFFWGKSRIILITVIRCKHKYSMMPTLFVMVCSSPNNRLTTIITAKSIFCTLFSSLTKSSQPHSWPENGWTEQKKRHVHIQIRCSELRQCAIYFWNVENVWPSVECSNAVIGGIKTMQTKQREYREKHRREKSQPYVRNKQRNPQQKHAHTQAKSVPTERTNRIWKLMEMNGKTEN